MMAPSQNHVICNWITGNNGDETGITLRSKVIFKYLCHLYAILYSMYYAIFMLLFLSPTYGAQAIVASTVAPVMYANKQALAQHLF